MAFRNDGLSRSAVITKETVNGGGHAEEIRHYFLKREFSESSRSVKQFKFPKAALLLDQAGTLEALSSR
jgi:hypothetical protein